MIFFSFCCDNKYRVSWSRAESGALDSMLVQSLQGADLSVSFEELSLSPSGSSAFQKLVEGLLEIDRLDAVRELPVREMRMLEDLENFDSPEILFRGFNWGSEYLRWSDVHNALCEAEGKAINRSTYEWRTLEVDPQTVKNNGVMMRRDIEGMCEESKAIQPTTKPQPAHWTSRVAPMDAKLNPFTSCSRPSCSRPSWSPK